MTFDRVPVATIDTNVLLSLQSTRLLASLPVLFERILVPSSVRSELTARPLENEPALRALREYAIFEGCDDFDFSLVKLLLDTRAQAKVERDRGEAEAVVQAVQRGAQFVLTDGGLGRRWTRDHRLEPHGTLWICRELRRTGYLEQLRPMFLRLIAAGRFQPRDEMKKILREFSEEEISDDQVSV
jgi:uncharacterized protein